MKKYYVAQAFLQVATAGSKPMMDFETILKEEGFKNIGLPSRVVKRGWIWWLWNRLSFAIAALRFPKGAVLAIQYPEPSIFLGKFYQKIRKRNPKTIVMVHDVEELRGMIPSSKDILQEADVVIAHTAPMIEWLKANYSSKAKYVELGIFDYLCYNDIGLDNTSKSMHHPASVVFAGNLAKASFIDKMELSPNKINLVLFGGGRKYTETSKEFIKYMGKCFPEELIGRIKNYDFGLVWDGDSINNCSGQMGEYLRYNAPYKMSSYLAAGLPVIVWNEMGMAKFVIREGIGVSVSSLEDIEKIISDMTLDMYNKMQRNAKGVAIKINQGHYSHHAVKKAEQFIKSIL